MAHLPLYIHITFIGTTLLSIFLFYKASGYSKIVLTILFSWLLVQSIISLSGFYTDTQSLPPKFSLTIVPTLICMLFLFTLKSGNAFLGRLDLKALTLLHIVRIPVEIGLFLLYKEGTIPKIMTFEGNNLDILSGITAIPIYFLMINHKIKTYGLVIWNIVCMLLLANIVATAILSAPFPFQRLAFDQPNIAVLYFPIVWLPCCIVPLVLLAHLASLKQILKK